MVKEKNKAWVLILGGSSGLGLATAKKLGKQGYNLIIVHRDRRSDLERIHRDFDQISSHGIQLKSFNIDAVNPDKRADVLIELKSIIKSDKINVLVHSIAKGNLKPMLSDNEKTLQNSDFQLTLDAMAISLIRLGQSFG